MRMHLDCRSKATAPACSANTLFLATFRGMRPFRCRPPTRSSPRRSPLACPEKLPKIATAPAGLKFVLVVPYWVVGSSLEGATGRCCRGVCAGAGGLDRWRLDRPYIGSISASPTARPYPRNGHAAGDADIEPRGATGRCCGGVCAGAGGLD